MKFFLNVSAALVLAVGPVAASSLSFVVLQDTEKDSLVRVSADGKSMTTIANGAAGVGLALDGSGNYIVAARTALLRVTPTGVVTKIAEAPAGSSWTALALDAAGNIIVADGQLPVVWRVSSDGKSVSKAAEYDGLDYPVERPVAVMVHPSGDYLLLVEGVVDHRIGPVTRLFRITSIGAVTEIPVRGPETSGDLGHRTRAPAAMVSDGMGNILFVDIRFRDSNDRSAVLRLTLDGVLSKFAELPRSCGHTITGLARDPETGGTVVVAPVCGLLARVSPNGTSVSPLAQRDKLIFPHAVVADPGR